MASGKRQLRLKLAEAQNWRCGYCGGLMSEAGISPATATCEHVVPKSRQGGNGYDNLVAACLACNASRGEANALGFSRVRARLGKLGIWPPCTMPSRRLRKWLARMAKAAALSEGPATHTFDIDAIRAHIRQHHPGCPPALAEKLAAKVARTTWSKPRIGFAFGCVSTNYVREHMTDYRRLLALPGMLAIEARTIVAAEVNARIAAWRTPLPPPS